jgi:hypothetical protein
MEPSRGLCVREQLLRDIGKSKRADEHQEYFREGKKLWHFWDNGGWK